MTPAQGLMTAEELLATSLPDMRTELVRGRLSVREPAGWRHGDIVARVAVAISSHLAAERRNLQLAESRGRVVAGDTGFTLQRNPDTVRAPDVAYIRKERLPTKNLDGFAEFAPDLAVEVRSPSDRAGTISARVADLLDAGTLLVWLVDPVRSVANVYRADGSESLLECTDSLSGEGVLPGLVIPLADLFD